MAGENRHNAAFVRGPRMLPKLIGAAVLIVLAADIARAQSIDEMWLMVPRNQDRLPENAAREREAERQYQNTVKNTTTGRKASNDPWRTIRPAPAAVPDRHKPQ